MKRFLAILLMFLALGAESALADGKRIPLGQVSEDGAALEALIQDQGEAGDDPGHDRVLEAVVSSADGGVSQTFRYHASVSPKFDPVAGFVRLDDLNFDGYQDLCFVTAQGARNVFYIFALWNADAGCFDPIMQGFPWLSEENKFAPTPSPLELCGYELLPETRQIVSEVADGYRYRTIIVYGWKNAREICEESVASVYDAGDGMIGELLELFGEQANLCWNESYPEDWYYEQEGVSEERRQSLKAIMLGSVATHPVCMRVSSSSWVNLRLQDSKESRSLAQLDAGTSVIVLCAECGHEDGWVRVWVKSPNEAGVHPLGVYDPTSGLTGYVWHSFLEAAE